MGGNRRYGGGIEDALNQWLIRAEPIGLTEDELKQSGPEVGRPEHGVPVRAWIRFPEASIEPTAEAIAWTERAVQVRFTLQDGRTKTVWIWKGAVSPRG